MLELNVTLDFTCCGCGQKVNVILKCAGKGLLADERAVATVDVPCPTCHNVNRLDFEPSGTVRAVALRPARYIPEPSWN